MNLLDDARRLADARITREGTVWCHFCGSMIELPESYDPFMSYAEQHDPDCPWQAMPRIVKALELAEWYGITFEEQADGLHLIRQRRRRNAP